MKELIGLETIDEIINRFTARFNIKADLGEEFQAFCDDRIINYTLAIEEEDINYFIKDAETRYPDICADIFLWCLLHEIGHVMTNNMWSDEELDYFEAQKEEMFRYSDADLRNNWYHCLPDEFHATRWAGNYMRKHPKKIAEFWNELHLAIMRFYLNNDLI